MSRSIVSYRHARPGQRLPTAGSPRRRKLLVAFLAAAAGAVALGVLLLPSPQQRPPSDQSITSRAVPSSSAPSPSQRLPQEPPFPVGITTVVLTDGTRVLPTVVRYPAAINGTGATPLRRRGPWPLIVFSEGYAIDPQAYSDLLGSWASAGFVVAEPVYPYTAPGSSEGLDEADIVNHPADLRAVIAGLLSLTSASSGNPLLAGLVTSGRVGVAGQSDGGDVTDAVAGGSCCFDPHVAAAVILSGAELESLGGTFRVPATTPLLVVQGDKDTINPPACSQEIYDSAAGSRYYLDLVGAGHHGPYLDQGALAQYSPAEPGNDADYRALVSRVTVAFWRSYLGRHPTRGLASITAAAAGVPAGLDQLVAGPPVPIIGECPGAPAP